jgi:hypothetical protein
VQGGAVTIKDGIFQSVTPQEVFDQRIKTTVIDKTAESINTLRATATGEDHTGTPVAGHDHYWRTLGQGPIVPIPAAGFVGIIPVPWVVADNTDDPISAEYKYLPIASNMGDITVGGVPTTNFLFEQETTLSTTRESFGALFESGTPVTLGLAHGKEPIHWAMIQTAAGNSVRVAALPMHATFDELPGPSATDEDILFWYRSSDESANANEYAVACVAEEHSRTFQFPVYPGAKSVIARLHCNAVILATENDSEKIVNGNVAIAYPTSLFLEESSWTFRLRLVNITDSTVGPWFNVSARDDYTNWEDPITGRNIPITLSIDLPLDQADYELKEFQIEWESRNKVSRKNYLYTKNTDFNSTVLYDPIPMLWFHDPEGNGPQPLLWMENRF